MSKEADGAWEYWRLVDGQHVSRKERQAALRQAVEATSRGSARACARALHEGRIRILEAELRSMVAGLAELRARLDVRDKDLEHLEAYVMGSEPDGEQNSGVAPDGSSEAGSPPVSESGTRAPHTGTQAAHPAHPAPEPDPVKALYRIAQGVQDPAGAARHTLLCMGEDAPDAPAPDEWKPQAGDSSQRAILYRERAREQDAPAPSEDTEGEVQPVGYVSSMSAKGVRAGEVHQLHGAPSTFTRRHAVVLQSEHHETVQRLQRRHDDLEKMYRNRDGRLAEAKAEIAGLKNALHLKEAEIARLSDPANWEVRRYANNKVRAFYVAPPESEGESDEH